MMKIFDVDYRRLVALMLPPVLRKPVLQAWLNSIVYAVQLLYNDFRANRKNNLYRLSITPQVCYLQKALNDRYDYVSRRIRIGENILHDPKYIFRREALKPLYVAGRAAGQPPFIYTRKETTDISVDFLVMLPAGLRYTEDEMRAFINSYKLASKDYKIQMT
ncbi:hypothetical protein [Chitinophaga solisilvae]|uniref:hypothetical protein n=1 Tax=Chitinophaga solisilvae TaxID=1233460 RepID=UPI00136C17BB|nr:hypothetical protein [Chitinophaga solisilvae]